jgi:alpha-amylase/alpha-mannosidase (GH57 family)
MKTCKLCKTEKPETEYQVRKSGQVEARCKDCINIAAVVAGYNGYGQTFVIKASLIKWNNRLTGQGGYEIDEHLIQFLNSRQGGY